MLESGTVTTLVVGAGYIGSRLIQELLYEAREVVALDNLFSSDSRAIGGFGQSPAFQFVEGSILDLAAVDRAIERAGEIDVVYLLAAQASAHPDAASPEYTEEVNLRGPRLVLEALARRGTVAPVVYASSLRIYGLPLPAQVDESTEVGTLTDLAHLSKCYAEKLLQMYAATRGLACRAVRLGLCYGVAPVMKMDRRFMTAPNLFCWQAANGEPLELRSAAYLGLLHVDDAAAALRCAAADASSGGYRVYNAVAEIETPAAIADLVRQCAAARDLTVEIVDRIPTGREASRPIVRSALADRGFFPRRRLDEGLAGVLDHFLVRGQ
jgi:nucleoside-diphosphate-sugar epimerase